MTEVAVQTAGTLLEALRASLLQAARYNPNDAVAPAAILWTDHDGQWQPVIPHLRRLVPELLTHGVYDPGTRTGPTIWLRCVIDRTLPEPALPEGAIPIIYLPGTSRQTLRAAQDCPDELKPLIELQYRGVCWMQRNGKDWTVEAFFLSEEGGLGLDVARDAATRHALHAALPELAATPLSRLRGKRLEAEDFDRLLTDDTVKDLLRWLNDADATRQEWSAAKWQAFKSRCKAELGFHPEKDGELVGAEYLGRHDGAWAGVWDRFAESPALYPGIPDLLRKAAPAQEGMFSDPSCWPQRNEEMETKLREELAKLENASPADAREAIRALEAEHGKRRDWVWARLGWAPLAMCLQHLNALADHTATLPGGAKLDDVAAAYADSGWRADLAVLDALAAVQTTADLQAVQAAVRSLYLPWLDQGAEHLQKVIEETPLPTITSGQEPIRVAAGEVVLFADGLRFDVANRLMDRLRNKGWEASLGRRWAGVPSVTATAKPAVSPVAADIKGDGLGEDFLPAVADGGEALTTHRFRKLLDAAGYQYLGSGEVGDSSGRAWTEYGDLDKLGHSLQVKLASRITEQIGLLVERVQALFDSGWKAVRIVTDHGWLLMPGGLPKVDLPKYLTQSRWARCAAIKGAAKVEVPTVPWHWNLHERVAVAPGVHCFGKGNEYAHGGVSLQECVTPDIRVSIGDAAAAASMTFGEVKWLGLRCHVRIDPAQEGISVDLRTKVNDPASSVAPPKATGANGEARLLVADDDLVGTPAIIVLVDAGGHVVGKQPTIIGGEDG